MKPIHQREGLARAGVWVVLKGGPEGPVVGKILSSYPRDGAGRLYLTMWTWIEPGQGHTMQTGSAGGYGYCKVSSVLGNMTIAGQPIKEGNWEASFRAAGFYPMRLV